MILKIFLALWLLVFGILIFREIPREEDDKPAPVFDQQEVDVKVVRQYSLTLFPPSMFFWKEYDRRK